MDLLRKLYFKCWRTPGLKWAAYHAQNSYSKLIRLKIKLANLNDLDTIYDEKFYEFSKEEVQKFAGNLVELIIADFKPKSVIDIGAGVGIYLNEFDKKGIEVIGYDGSSHAIKNSVAREGLLKLHDLRNDFSTDKKFDLGISIEVAEHINTELSEKLVKALVSSSDKVVFTAAQPGQGGTDHINEQPRSFWVELFEKNGLSYDAKKTNNLVNQIKTTNIPWWIYENLMIFNKREKEGI